MPVSINHNPEPKRVDDVDNVSILKSVLRFATSLGRKWWWLDGNAKKIRFILFFPINLVKHAFKYYFQPFAAPKSSGGLSLRTREIFGITPITFKAMEQTYKMTGGGVVQLDSKSNFLYVRIQDNLRTKLVEKIRSNNPQMGVSLFYPDAEKTGVLAKAHLNVLDYFQASELKPEDNVAKQSGKVVKFDRVEFVQDLENHNSQRAGVAASFYLKIYSRDLITVRRDIAAKFAPTNIEKDSKLFFRVDIAEYRPGMPAESNQ